MYIYTYIHAYMHTYIHFIHKRIQVLKAQVLHKQIQQFKRTEVLESKMNRVEDVLLQVVVCLVCMYTCMYIMYGMLCMYV